MVEPKYQVNLGYIARVAKNFGIEELYLVNPRCNWKGKQAIKYSKHAHELLEKAKIRSSIGSASKGFLLLGTTGIWRKAQNSFQNAYTLDRISKMIKGNRSRKVCILIGRDDTGLSKEEVRDCDAIVFIPTATGYPILNISHALAIMLYVINGSRSDETEALYATGEIDGFVKLFYRNISKKEKIRDPKAVSQVLGRILRRANATKMEINALHAAFSDN
jgi:tRNA/rRNA methyltransferase